MARMVMTVHFTAIEGEHGVSRDEMDDLADAIAQKVSEADGTERREPGNPRLRCAAAR
jgi:hypothetical protein